MIPTAPNTPAPVWSVVFGDAWHINGIILKLIFLDLGLQVLGLGPARARPGPVAPFPLQLLLLGLPVFDGGAHIVVLAQLQEPPVTLLVLPVCQDLKESDAPLGPASSAGQGRSRTGETTLRLRPQHLRLSLQDAEAAAGGREQRLQLQLQRVQLLDADPVVLGAGQHGRVPGAHLRVVHRLEVVELQRAVLQLAHGGSTGYRGHRGSAGNRGDAGELGKMKGNGAAESRGAAES